MDRQETGTEAWRPLYRAERDATLIGRVRVVVGVIVPVVLVLTPYMILKEPATLIPRVILGLMYIVLALAVWLATRRLEMQRYAIALSLAFMAVLLATTVVYWWVTPHEGSSALSCMMVIMMASSLFLPWGLWPQVIVSVASILAYLAVTIQVPEAFETFSLSLMVSMAPVVAVGARLMDGYRQEIFARSWLRGQLVGLARELADYDDPEQVLATGVQEGARLLAAEGSGWIHDPAAGVFRLSAVGGAEPDPAWIGLELESDFPMIRTLLEQRMIAQPDDLPDAPMGETVESLGLKRLLHVALYHGSEVVGFFSFSRKDDVAFGPFERAAIESLADQCAAALHGARLLSDLRQANHLRSQFVSTMSHELRTPLNVILGFVDMASDPDIEPPDHAHCLGRIEGAGRDLLELIESTLEIGRLDAGRDETELTQVPLADFWEELGAACLALPRRPDVELDWRQGPPDTSMHTDTRKLTIIVRNLVGNALKFTEHGHVRAEVALEDDDVVLVISDTGPGIEVTQQGIVFEMFRQGDGSDSRAHGGTGLGLYIVRRFVEQLEGTVTLESSGGRGATFTVRLAGALGLKRATAAA